MPTANTRLGYVYYPDDRHFTQDDLRVWLPILKDLGAHWLTLFASPERAVPESFLTSLIEAGIEPIIHVRSRLGRTQSSAMLPLFRSYSRWGVKYVVAFDRPNLRNNWANSEWNRKGLVERFLDFTLPLLEAQLSAGLKPVLSPLEPGGDYWDTAFLRSVLESLTRRGKTDLLHELHLAIYAWTHGKPLDWGAGGPSRWPEARPYHTPPNCQDQLGFRIFDWYAEIARLSIGHVLPILVVAGGAIPDQTAGGGYSNIEIEQNVGILRALSLNDVPDHVLNYSFFCLTAAENTEEAVKAWYPNAAQPSPIVEAVRRVLRTQVKQPTASIRKPLKHYVLLSAAVDLNTASESLTTFAKIHKPVLGFSVKEARMAHKVTLAGCEKMFPVKLENELVGAGCIVDRLTIEAQDCGTVPSENFTPLGGS